MSASRFGTIKARMGATHFLMKTLPRVASEMALHVLAYNLTRAINPMGGGYESVVAAPLSPDSRRHQQAVFTRPRPMAGIEFRQPSARAWDAYPYAQIIRRLAKQKQ